MGTRFNKVTPIAASVALSLGLTGCFGDDDKDTNITPKPKADVEATASTNFSTSIEGRAVKGTLKGALLTVQTIDENGKFVDIAFRTESGEVKAKATAGTEAEALSQAQNKIISENPSNVRTGDKGEYQIFLADDFNGPVHITVKTKKEGDDSLVKCDAFVGCGDFSAASDLDDNKNGSVDFGEWYKDNIELSVVKVIKPVSTAASKRGAQFAEGDEANSFKANLTIFTSAAASILISKAAEGEIDSAAISEASSTVIKALIGDEALLAALAGDISEGGAVDFTDVDGSEEIDAGVLTLIQVAASIQAVAAQAGTGSIEDVISTLQNDLVENNLAESSTFTQLKQEAKKAGTILEAVVSGDEEKIKEALVAAGVDEETASSTAKTAKDAKDKAVDSGATTDEDLKKDSDESKKQLDDIGDGQALENAKLAELLTEDLAKLRTELESVQSAMTGFAATLASVKAQGEDLSTNEQVIAYSVAAKELQEALAGSEEIVSLERLTTTATQLETSSTELAAKDEQYKSIADEASSLKGSVDEESAKVAPLKESADAENEKAQEEVEELGLQVEQAKGLVESAITAVETARVESDRTEQAFTDALNAVEAASIDLSNVDDANKAIELLQLAELANIENHAAATNYMEAANTAAAKAEEYVKVAKDTDSEADSLSLEGSTQTLVEQAQVALDLAFEVSRESRLIELSDIIYNAKASEAAKVGTDKLVNVSIVTKEGADAVYNVGEIIFDVVLDIIEDGTFNSGSQSGTSEKYPEWTYRYNTEDLLFTFENTEDGQKVEAEGSFLSSSQSKLVFTWSGNVKADSGQKIEIVAPDLASCESFAVSNIAPNASCAVVFFDGRVSDFDDAGDVDITKVSSFNIVEFVDGQYGFDGKVLFDLTALDPNGNTTAPFTQNAVEYVTFTVEGVTESTEFNATFDVKYDEPKEEIGVLSVQLLNYMGYEFAVNLVDESGPLLGTVSIFDETMGRLVAGQVTEITNGFNISYLNGESIDYTNIDFLGMSVSR